MSMAVMRKSFRDALPLLILVTFGVLLLETLIVGLMGAFGNELGNLWQNVAFFKRIVQLFLGAEFEGFTPMTLLTIGYAHPLLYACTWGFLIAACSKCIAGEIDRGTADLVMTLPLSRRSIYVSMSIVWLGCSMLICAAVPLGTRIGIAIFGTQEPADFLSFARVAVNLFALCLSVAGATLLASSHFSRRGPAIAVVLVWLLSSFLLNFLSPFWDFFERLSYVGLLRYYQPLAIVKSGELAVSDVAVLFAMAGVFWTAGLMRFARRDIPAA